MLCGSIKNKSLCWVFITVLVNFFAPASYAGSLDECHRVVQGMTVPQGIGLETFHKDIVIANSREKQAFGLMKTSQQEGQANVRVLQSAYETKGGTVKLSDIRSNRVLTTAFIAQAEDQMMKDTFAGADRKLLLKTGDAIAHLTKHTQGVHFRRITREERQHVLQATVRTAYHLAVTNKITRDMQDLEAVFQFSKKYIQGTSVSSDRQQIHLRESDAEAKAIVMTYTLLSDYQSVTIDHLVSNLGALGVKFWRKSGAKKLLTDTRRIKEKFSRLYQVCSERVSKPTWKSLVVRTLSAFTYFTSNPVGAVQKTALESLKYLYPTKVCACVSNHKWLSLGLGSMVVMAGVYPLVTSDPYGENASPLVVKPIPQSPVVFSNPPFANLVYTGKEVFPVCFQTSLPACLDRKKEFGTPEEETVAPDEELQTPEETSIPEEKPDPAVTGWSGWLTKKVVAAASGVGTIMTGVLFYQFHNHQ